jgi:hypothetical protein
MKKNNLLGLIFLSLSIASVSLPLMPSQAQAWGRRYYSSYPVAGDACSKQRGDTSWVCYRTPGGDHGVRIRVGSRLVRF